jgi:hypothetical protein
MGKSIASIEAIPEWLRIVTADEARDWVNQRMDLMLP